MSLGNLPISCYAIKLPARKQGRSVFGLALPAQSTGAEAGRMRAKTLRLIGATPATAKPKSP